MTRRLGAAIETWPTGKSRVPLHTATRRIRAGPAFDDPEYPVTRGCVTTCRGSGDWTVSTSVHPAVPHRYRHGVARPARRPFGDRVGLLSCRTSTPGRAFEPQGQRPTCASSSPTCDGAVGVLGAGCCDVVYTGIGAICWLPDIRRWAAIVAPKLLRPGWPACSSGRAIPCCGANERTPKARTGPVGARVSVLSRPTARFFVEHDTYGRRRPSSPHPSRSSFQPWSRRDLPPRSPRQGLAVTALEEHREVAVEPVGTTRMIPSPDFEEEYILAEGRDRMPLTLHPAGSQALDLDRSNAAVRRARRVGGCVRPCRPQTTPAARAEGRTLKTYSWKR